MCSEFDKDSGQLVRSFGGYVSFAGERSQILSVQRGCRYVDATFIGIVVS